MVKKRFNNSTKGFTLIEIIVTISLISLVLLIAANMQGSFNKLFFKGDAKADIQSNLRLNADYISNQVRYASNVRILPDIPAAFDVNKQYIYIKDGTVKHYKGGISQDVPGSLGGVAATLSFSEQDIQTINLKIDGQFRGEGYQVETSIVMLNVGMGGLVAGSIGTAIEYTPGTPVDIKLNAKPVESIAINTVPEGAVSIGQNGTMVFTSVVNPSDASINTVYWSATVDNIQSSAASMVSIDAATGRLNLTNAPVGAIIRVKATACDGSGISSGEHVLTVSSAPPDTPVTSITVKSDYDYIYQKNGSLQMTADIAPFNATDKTVTWSINKDNSVATIDSDGILKTLGNNTFSGSIEVTATASDGAVYNRKLITILPNINEDALYISYASHGNTCTITCYRNDRVTKISSGKDVKEIKYYVNSGEYKTVTGNPFTIELKNKDTLYIKITPLSGDDIIITK